MKKIFKQLGQTDRDPIQALLDVGESQKSIAGILRVDKSTISREIKKRRLSNGEYMKFGKSYELPVNPTNFL